MIQYIMKLGIIMTAAAPAYILLRRPWKRPGCREMVLGAFTLFMTALLALVMEGTYTAPSLMIKSAAERVQSGEKINLVPFRTISSFFGTHRGLDAALVNIAGNIIMFMPWGLGLVTLWKKNQSVIRILLLSAVFPFLIEMYQLFIGRSVDVDDFILNFIGGCMGAALYAGLKKWIPGIENLAI